MTDEQLRDLGKQLPFDRPDATRRDAIRSSLLVEAAESGRHTEPRRRWIVVGAAFASGALAAAAVAVLLLRDPRTSVDLPNPAQITASSEAHIDHQVVATESGVDEIVRVHDGTVRIATPAQRRGDRVRLRTRNAEVETAAPSEYEVIVVAESLDAVTVRSGTAEIRVVGQNTVLLSAGQTWRASVITTDLSPAPTPSRPSVRTSDTANRPPAVRPSDTANRPSDIAVRPSDTANQPSTVRPSDTANRPSTVRPSDIAGRPSDTAVRPSDVRPSDTGRRSDIASRPPDTGVRPSDGAGGAGRRDKAPDAAPRPASADADSRAFADRVAGARDGDTAAAAASAKSPRVASAIERRFQAGWSLLKSGKAKEAAAELGAAADAWPADPLAVDARYFQAVALVRAGERAQAERVLVRFLDSAPRSLRRGRAAVLLGRLIGDRGDLASARAWLESAVSDADPAIASAARAGLQALERKPGR